MVDVYSDTTEHIRSFVPTQNLAFDYPTMTPTNHSVSSTQV